MKTLILIRHAKSDWHLGLPDFERPLNIRGLKEVPVMADRLKGKIGNLDALVHSTAVRTTQTATYFIERLDVMNVFPISKIYEADLENLLDCISEIGDEFEKAALVGHNPGVSQLVYYFTAQNLDMKTCAMACITFQETEWSKISEKSGTLQWLEIPSR